MPAWSPIDLKSVRITGGLIAERQRTILDRSLQQQHRQCLTTGRIAALELKWRPDSTGIPKPHPFWDSDLAKWIESAAYGLVIRPDAGLEAKVDAVIEGIERAQEPSGYFNSYYQAVEPDRRFSNLRDMHELYCAGHLIEAAVAYQHATGKGKLLEVMCRYADYIGQVFGPNPGQKPGYDGHEEIELALVKLARATGRREYLELARFFIEARGQDQPHFFDTEAQARGEKPRGASGYDYFQAHKPVRQQHTVEGHSVRQLYLLAGVADVAGELGDAGLLQAARKAFSNCVERRMYVTGGVGSTRHGERFTYDYDLPNESAYAETCASIALVFFAQRMMNLERDGKYADVIDTALYNTCLAGISLDGEKYFYANYLATDPAWHDFEHGYKAQRQGWFDCACCPPNLTRLLAAFGSHAYSVREGEIAVNLFAGSTMTGRIAGVPITLTQRTDYPWEGKVRIEVGCGKPVAFTLAVRIPGWCEGPSLSVGGKRVPGDVRKLAKRGYVYLKRTWRPGDVVELELPMPVRRLYSDVRVRHNTGRVALARGPVVYCLEEKDNGPALASLLLPSKAKLTARRERKLLGGVVTLAAAGRREHNRGDGLYGTLAPREGPARLKFVPYYAWANRGRGEMTVWVRELR